MAKPLISANQVTILRLLPMPFYAWLLYQYENEWSWWLAFGLGAVISSTDFVDGYLARKHGPTILGGLLDPMADKIFVALSFMPLVDIGLIPWWTVALMFTREFVVTSLRTIYEIRDISMKTSYLGKVKTWTQMQGLVAILLIVLLAGKPILDYIIWGAVAIPLIAGVAISLMRKKLWKGSIVMFGGQLAFAIIYENVEIPELVKIVMYIIVGITLLSGVDYVRDGFIHLRGRGDLHPGEFVRVIAGLAIPWLAVAVLFYTEALWAPMAIICAELALGGLDNLLAHHKAHGRATPWIARTGAIIAGLTVALVIEDTTAVKAAVFVAAVASVVGVGVEFIRGRQYYLKGKHRNKTA